MGFIIPPPIPQPKPKCKDCVYYENKFPYCEKDYSYCNFWFKDTKENKTCDNFKKLN